MAEHVADSAGASRSKVRRMVKWADHHDGGKLTTVYLPKPNHRPVVASGPCLTRNSSLQDRLAQPGPSKNHEEQSETKALSPPSGDRHTAAKKPIQTQEPSVTKRQINPRPIIAGKAQLSHDELAEQVEEYLAIATAAVVRRRQKEIEMARRKAEQRQYEERLLNSATGIRARAAFSG